MKKSFFRTFIVLVLGFSFVFPISAFAQTNSGALQSYITGGASGIATYAAVQATRSVAGSVAGSVAAGIGASILNEAILPFFNWAVYALLAIVQFLLLLFGRVFDFVFNEMVGYGNAQFGTMGLRALIEPAMRSTWYVIRDVCNIAIVFSLLYLAIRTILQGNGFAERRTLAGIILAALLINFSWFATNVVLDTSNYIGRQIADQMRSDGGVGVQESSGSSSSYSVSAQIVGMVKPQSVIDTFWNQGTFGGQRTSLEQTASNLQAGFLTIVTLLALGCILAGACIMLLYRFVVFVVLVITSPIGLISIFIPWFKNAGNKWWHMLKSQAIFLPAFMLTLYVSLGMIANFTAIGGSGPVNIVAGSGGSDSITAFANGVAVFAFKFSLTCAFLLAILWAPVKIAGAGADIMTSATTWTARRLGQYTARGVAATGRGTVGRTGARLVTSDTLKSAAQQKGFTGMAARALMGVGNSAQSASFDPRNVGGIGKKLKLGDVKKGGYAGRIKDAQKEATQKMRKELGMFGFAADQAGAEGLKKKAEGFFGADYAQKIRSYDINAAASQIAGISKEIKQMDDQRNAGGTIDTDRYDYLKGAYASREKEIEFIQEANKEGNHKIYRKMQKGRKVGFDAYGDLMDARMYGGNKVTQALMVMRNGGNKRLWFNPRLFGVQKVRKELASRTADSHNKEMEKIKREEEKKKKAEESKNT